MAKTSVDNKYVRDSIQNVQTNEITISEDKLRNKLERQIKRIKQASGTFSYLSVAITCLGVLVSTDFKEFVGITPDMWKMLFIIAAFVFFYLFLKSVFFALFHKVTVDTVVTDIKTIDSTSQAEGFWVKLQNACLSKGKNKDSGEEKK